MNKALKQQPDIKSHVRKTLIIGISSRNLLGFFYMWIHLFSFIRETMNAEGCLEVIPGITSPFQFILISYWDSDQALEKFVRHPEHVKWMRFIYKNPSTLNLFNETYANPERANFINSPKGFAVAVEENSESQA